MESKNHERCALPSQVTEWQLAKWVWKELDNPRIKSKTMDFMNKTLSFKMSNSTMSHEWILLGQGKFYEK